MAKTEWAAQYKHPNWQRKRLEVLEFHEFSCEACHDKTTTLHVHHKRYVKGRKIWEYDISELEALCEPCHEDAHALKDQFAEAMGELCLYSQEEALSLLRGFARSEGGATLAKWGDESGPNANLWFWGAIASDLAFFSLEEQREFAVRIIEIVKAKIPSATEYHAQLEVALQHFRGWSKDA